MLAFYQLITRCLGSKRSLVSALVATVALSACASQEGTYGTDTSAKSDTNATEPATVRASCPGLVKNSRISFLMNRNSPTLTIDVWDETGKGQHPAWNGGSLANQLNFEVSGESRRHSCKSYIRNRCIAVSGSGSWNADTDRNVPQGLFTDIQFLPVPEQSAPVRSIYTNDQAPQPVERGNDVIHLYLKHATAPSIALSECTITFRDTLQATRQSILNL